MILLQLSAAQGPDECCLAVAKALARVEAEAHEAGVALDVIERDAGARAGTWRSVLVALDGDGAEGLAARWNGTVQWICASPYRPQHGRKNWFIGGRRYAPPPAALESEIRFETARASGAGGQHVNKTESAVRATHVASGIVVRVQSERSQHANKRVAVALIAQKLAQAAQRNEDDLRAQRRLAHHALERGAAVLVFRGERFEAA
ncbi:peptide chain release factor H [Tahibacter soli]|jgi:peptide chain release factor|uniref:Peptide chain release factor H n=1 Tax=Tahibacter soli TaxID=2983605 RepID=A0A9X4BK35_9GAMM|nr:peptide chain release factor H [Tahibacter soli]MDC8015746.1 peptide chain release factor H [Tahibacter soli]